MRWCCVIVLVLTACSSKPPETLEAVESLIEHGDLQEAAAQAKRLIIAHPDDPSLRVLLGRIYLAQKDGAGAYDAFDRARQLGASEESTRNGLVEGLVLQGRFEQVLGMLPTSLERSELPAPLIRFRLEALLRIPLARPRDILLDSQQVLVSGGADGVVSLEAVLRGDGVVEANADQIRRAIAYWSCQQVGDEQEVLLFLSRHKLFENGDKHLMMVSELHSIHTGMIQIDMKNGFQLAQQQAHPVEAVIELLQVLKCLRTGVIPETICKRWS